ncbi:ribosomal protein S18-alanine N-acetyltransferase [Terriglobus roseus]|uniref:Ribosomal-protein-alanine N-acetyltransferase n=1 Tax=Terriglobus roseus TaxID=392734 RepID=A0A1G7R6Q2_9BACT|nr:ribosomal protein S18-alanine N-acetyltransferase [Terriglobus roseus]SDG05829.1 ribosomal-protein-alanine N-acetyltransferase [Terriglobus roseus]
MRLMVRAATADELQQVYEIAVANPSAPQWTLAQFAEILSPGESAVTRELLVAMGDTAVLGFAVVSAVTIVYPVEAELESIAVAPEWHRQGVGRALMQEVLRWAESAGAAELRLEVRVSNTGAQKLYEESGFHSNGMRPRYYANPVEDAVCMIRGTSVTKV